MKLSMRNTRTSKNKVKQALNTETIKVLKEKITKIWYINVCHYMVYNDKN